MTNQILDYLKSNGMTVENGKIVETKPKLRSKIRAKLQSIYDDFQNELEIDDKRFKKGLSDLPPQNNWGIICDEQCDLTVLMLIKAIDGL